METCGVLAAALAKGERLLNVNRADILTGKDGVSVLPNQLGGHKRPWCLLEWGNNVLKPLQAKGKGEKEVIMYESFTMASREVDALVSLKENGFCVDYFGVVNVQLDGLHSRPIPCLALLNVTAGFKWPCVMDIKVGQKTYDSEESKAKQLYELEKYPLMHRVGFRFIGMILRHKGKVSEPEVIGKDWGKKLELHDAARGFVKFFHDGSTTGFRHDELLALIRRLGDLIEWFGIQKCALFISSSLLIAYNACKDNRQCEAVRLTVRMIDFTHSGLQTKASEQCLDDGYLFGLKNMYTSLKELSALNLLGNEEEVAARLRDRKLWSQSP